MTDREKVIKGLECCIAFDDHECTNRACPYHEACGTLGASQELMKDALALLKAQEPRVMTLEEVLSLKPDTPIYIQYKSGASGWDIYRGIEDDITCDIITGSMWAEGEYWYQKEYGKSWICWSSHPTDEQRKEVKWE